MTTMLTIKIQLIRFKGKEKKELFIQNTIILQFLSI